MDKFTERDGNLEKPKKDLTPKAGGMTRLWAEQSEAQSRHSPSEEEGSSRDASVRATEAGKGQQEEPVSDALKMKKQPDEVLYAIRNFVRHPEQRELLQERILKQQKAFLIREGKRLYEERTHKLASRSAAERIEEFNARVDNHEQRYDIKKASNLYHWEIAEDFSAATTVESRVKGYEGACHINTIDLESGISWAHVSYKGRPLENELPLNGDIEHLMQRDANINSIAAYIFSRDQRKSKAGKYDNEAQPFTVGKNGEKVYLSGTKASFNSDAYIFQVKFLAERTNFSKSSYVPKELRIMDIIGRDSIQIISLFLEKNNTRTFEIGQDEFFGLLLAPNIKTALYMSDITMALSLPHEYEFYKVEIGRGNKDTKIDWVTCFFRQQ